MSNWIRSTLHGTSLSSCHCVCEATRIVTGTEVSVRLTQHGDTPPQLRCGEERTIDKNLRPCKYIGDRPVRSYKCLPTRIEVATVWFHVKLEKEVGPREMKSSSLNFISVVTTGVLCREDVKPLSVFLLVSLIWSRHFLVYRSRLLSIRVSARDRLRCN